MKYLKKYKFDWSEVSDKLEKEFEFKDFSEALKFINELAKICEQQNHHPEINWIYNKVKLTLSTHDVGDIVTEKDLKLSKSIDGVKQLFEDNNYFHQSGLNESLETNNYTFIGSYENDEEKYLCGEFWLSDTYSFNKLEIDKIRNIFSNVGSELSINYSSSLILGYASKHHKILLKKFYDGYYGVKFHDDSYEYFEKFYKCDQFDGLLNCLKKEFNVS